MDYPKYFGNYLAIVVQNNDPQYRGRVKVFVPHISPSVYKNWIENSKDTPAKDKLIKFIGNNVGSDLTDVIEDLKLILPWAEVTAPIAGAASAGRYHAASKQATTSDSSNRDYHYTESSTSFAQNLDNIGEKPGNIYDQAIVNLSDAFNNPQLTNANNVNKLSYNYTPECYSNSAKGSFAIPNVGAHVWVFFNEGDPLKPVVFGVSYGASDWSSIFDAAPGQPGIDYPGEYENDSKGTQSINAETYRNKYVINQKGGTLAFVNTDNREILKLTHYSGSFKEFNNQANVELATNNDQKLVLGDLFDTVRGSRNNFTQRDSDVIIHGDHYRKVGDLNVVLYKNWKQLMDPIADIKQLFDIRRTSGMTSGVNSLIKLNGKGQSQSGSFAPCPVCAPIGDTNSKAGMFLNLSSKALQATGVTSHSNNIGGDMVGSFKSLLFSGLQSGFSPSLLKSFPGAFIPSIQSFMGIIPAKAIPGLGSITCTDGSTIPNSIGSPLGKTCPACGGSGLSPSSFNGVWARETKKFIDLPQKIAAIIPQLARLEAQMGLGGSEIVEITKHKIETIGTVMNDWGAIRVDPKGKMEDAYIQVQPGGTLIVKKETPLIEQVQVDDLPGGTYTLNVCNKYNVLVGAGGLNLKSYGVVNIVGAMTNIAGEQVNIGSANEVNIDGGRRLSLVGDVVSIKQRYGEQILIDGSIGITGNVYVKGGIYAEGRVSTHELEAPHSIQQTHKSKVTGNPVPDMCNGTGLPVDIKGNFDLQSAITGELNPTTLKPGKAIFMGYTDPGSYVGWVPELSVVGYIEAGTYIGSNLGGPLYTTNRIPVYSYGFPVVGLGATLADSPTQELPPRQDLRTTPVQTGFTGFTYQMAQLQNNTDGNIRGLPRKTIIAKLIAQQQPLQAGATEFPIINFGLGSHRDCTVMADHSHSYVEGHTGTNHDIRTSAASNLGARANISQSKGG